MIELRIHDTIGSIPEEDWDSLLGVEQAPFLRWAWLDALERTGCVGGETGWVPHHVTLHEAGAMVAAAPGYLKTNSEGEFIFDHGWAGAARRAGIRYYPKLIFAVPFTPATAPRLLTAPNADRERLLVGFAEGVRKLVELHAISSAHVLFPPSGDADVLGRAGLAHRFGLQFQWHNAGYGSFDDYLARFSAKRRHQIRRERRAVREAGIAIETLRGSDLTPEIVDAMFGFYLTTVDKFTWGRRYLNRAFFEEITCKLPGKIEVVLAREGGRPIAGALNLASDRALYGRYWGATAERPFLHFCVCYYHAIEDCIVGKRDRFEPGAGGEHKVVRGFEPTITHSVHHLADARLDRAVREFLERERDAIQEITSQPDVAWRGRG